MLFEWMPSRFDGVPLALFPYVEFELMLNVFSGPFRASS